MYSERTNGFDAKIIAENKRIPLLGLTGSMAAGKSTVSAMLAERGFFIVDADKTAHDVIQTEKVLRKPRIDERRAAAQNEARREHTG